MLGSVTVIVLKRLAKRVLKNNILERAFWSFLQGALASISIEQKLDFKTIFYAGLMFSLSATKTFVVEKIESRKNM